MSYRENSFANELYEKSAELGTWKNKIFFWIAVVVAICLLISGIKLFFTDQSNLIDVIGKVQKINNSFIETIREKDNIRKIYKYNVEVSYKVQGETQERTATINIESMSPYAVNSAIELTYDKNIPEVVTIKVTRNKTLALILSVIGTIILLITGLNYWLSRRFKLYAAAEGVGTIANIVSMPFRQ